MRVQDLQEFLAKFTEGSEAIRNAHIFVEVSGKLAEVKRMEVHDHAVPRLGYPGQPAHRLVMKTQKESKLIIPTKLKDDY